MMWEPPPPGSPRDYNKCAMDDVRRQLDELKATLRSTLPLSAGRRPQPPVPLEVVLGGAEARSGEHAYWLVETLFDAVWSGHGIECSRFAAPLPDPCGGKQPAVVDPRRTMVVDIETGGFAGTPVFLIGVVLLDQWPLAVRQLLARDYPEEETILRALAELATARDTWVTFNGRAFDEPMLRDRATLYRVPLRPPRRHVDLLPAARRSWRGTLPNCRLTTLERHILRRERIDDVPSSDVPDLFHHFMRTGNAAPLRAVLEHNRIDLLSATELLLRLASGE
jgi:uncharacterized protein YprB with RNaseH-like and TPR domain